MTTNGKTMTEAEFRAQIEAEIRAKFAQLPALFDQWAEAKSAQEAVEKAYREHTGENPEYFTSNYKNAPKMPDVVTDLDMYIELVIESRVFKARAEYLREQYKVTCKTLSDLEGKIREIMPSLVWVRHGDLGFGIAFTNWGGSKHYLVVENWQAEMPSLDHTYHGD